MNNLLQTAVDAHGGLKRWNQASSIKGAATITEASWSREEQTHLPKEWGHDRRHKDRASGHQLREALILLPQIPDLHRRGVLEGVAAHPRLPRLHEVLQPRVIQRQDVYASPLQAANERLKGLAPALIQTAEMDVLPDEGEAYARKLDHAGVDVISTRYNGLIHDCGVLNAISHASGVRSPMLQASAELQKRLR